MSPSIDDMYRSSFFFFNDPATTEIYTLSLHDALPIFTSRLVDMPEKRLMLAVLLDAIIQLRRPGSTGALEAAEWIRDRKSTRLNSSHRCISYAVFCLKKKKTKKM